MPAKWQVKTKEESYEETTDMPFYVHIYDRAGLSFSRMC